MAVKKSRQTHMRKAFVAALIVLAAVAWWWMQDSNAAAPAAQYITAPVERGEIRRVISSTGTLNAIVNVEVGSQLSGQIAQLFVDFNDEVRKGQPLAELDQKSFKARVAEAQANISLAEANLQVAKARLERARIDARDSEAQRAVLNARTDNARVKLDAANLELHRKEILQQRQIGASVELEDARTKAASAAAALREAEAIASAHENNVSGAKADLARVQSELDSAIASLPQKTVLLDVAAIDLDRTVIRSPIDGVVVGRNVNEGQTLATTLEAKTLFIIAGNLHQMQIEAKVDEADIGAIRDGQEATFTVDAYPGRQFKAEVRQVRKAPKVEQNVVTYTVVLSAANPDKLLLPGMTALVRITVSKQGPVLKLPLAALRYVPNPGLAAPAQTAVSSGKPATVWVLAESGEPKPVIVGLGDDETTDAAVLSGPLAQGDKVIVGNIAAPAARSLFGIQIGL